MATVIYNKYTESGTFLGEREYHPANRPDYERVMAIIENNPDEYELVNVVDIDSLPMWETGK